MTPEPLPDPQPWLGYSLPVACVWFFGSLAVLSLALVLDVGEDRAVVVPGLQVTLPELCWLYRTSGIDCPGCGLTWTFVNVAHGRLAAAWALSPAGWLVFMLAVMQLPFGFAQVVLRRRDRWIERWDHWNVVVLVVVASGLILQWSVRMVLASSW
jgi:hypothetical protein